MLFGIILLVVALIGLVVYLKRDEHETQSPSVSFDPYPSAADRKGIRGERIVQRILNRLPKEDYIVLNDVLLPNGRGTTQIDHIVVSVYGIFVIEAKNYSGKIYGSHESEEWTQYLIGEQHKFRNPIKQNEGHVRSIQRLTLVGRQYIIPLVVFTGSATVKARGCDEVIYANALYQTICRYRSRVFTEELMRVYARILDDALDETRAAKQAHVAGVQKIIDRRNDEILAGQCPLCDGHMVLRSGRHGYFYGCSNYPKCKYTRNIRF